MCLAFLWIGDDFFKDDVSSLLSVGQRVMESMNKSAEIFDLAKILKELYLFDDGGMAEWIGDEVPAEKKRKAMSDVTSRLILWTSWHRIWIEDDVKGIRAEKHREKHNVCRAQFPVLVWLAREAKQPSA